MRRTLTLCKVDYAQRKKRCRWETISKYIWINKSKLFIGNPKLASEESGLILATGSYSYWLKKKMCVKSKKPCNTLLLLFVSKIELIMLSKKYWFEYQSMIGLLIIISIEITMQIMNVMSQNDRYFNF